jgi:CubicO group peptidase (beta-lactamase class C family)
VQRRGGAAAEPAHVTRTAPGKAGFSSERLGRLTRALEGTVSRGEMAGIAATVRRGGATVFHEAHGWADVAARRPMADDSILQFASMTKPITAAAKMSLYEEGRFDLDTPVRAFIPGFKDLQVCRSENRDGSLDLARLERDVTMRHLFTYSAGLSYGWNEQDPVDRAYRRFFDHYPDGKGLTLALMAEHMCRLPLAFQPGTQYRYSLCVDILGALVEIISGVRFEVFLQERIFGPLGMLDSGFHVPPARASRAATVYDRSGPGGMLQPAERIRIPTELPSYPSPGGGLVSTVADYSRFCQMLVNGGELDGARVLSPTTVALFSMNHASPETLQSLAANDLEMAGFGLSLATRVLMDVSRTGRYGSPGEFGWEGAWTTYFWIDPKESLFGIVAAQYSPIHFPLFRRFKQLTYQAMT